MNELTYFHVCDGSLLPDIMHDVLEGALQYEVKLLLKRMVNCDNYFALETLNSRLENLDLGYIDVKNRPTPISAKQLNSDGSSLKQNGLCHLSDINYNCVYFQHRRCGYLDVFCLLLLEILYRMEMITGIYIYK